jgi:hypothetical protein
VETELPVLPLPPSTIAPSTYTRSNGDIAVFNWAPIERRIEVDLHEAAGLRGGGGGSGSGGGSSGGGGSGGGEIAGGGGNSGGGGNGRGALAARSIRCTDAREGSDLPVEKGSSVLRLLVAARSSSAVFFQRGRREAESIL